MEVLIPNSDSNSNLDFDFNNSSARSSPQVMSQPSSPKSSSFNNIVGGLGYYYFSAPTSPSHLSSFYNNNININHDFNNIIADHQSVSNNNNGSDFDFDFDFAFDVNVNNNRGSWEKSAEELFDNGLIKPLEPAAQPKNGAKAKTAPSQRGREIGGKLNHSSSRRVAHSLSPIRDNTTQYPWVEQEQEQEQHEDEDIIEKNIVPSRSKKWRLKDFFLFRSASEGRATDKDPFKKYTAAYKHSSDKPAGSTRRRGPVEMHYTANRAVSEDLKKKTFLPYKQGILGRLAFNPAVHALANGFGFSRK